MAGRERGQWPARALVLALGLIAVAGLVLAFGGGAAADAARMKCGLKGTPKADRLVGGARDDVICGRGGADVLIGRGGDDVLLGAAGSDRLKGGLGADRLIGGGGKDLLRGGAHDDVHRGAAGDDKIAGAGGDDRVVGGGGDDRVSGGSGADRLAGGDDDDALYGDPHRDRLSGGVGDDYLDGGPGDDLLDGGIGLNTCVNDGGDEEIDCVDHEPPELHSFKVTPRSQDTSDPEAVFTMKARISDDLSGAKEVNFRLGREGETGWHSNDLGSYLASGSINDGYWEGIQRVVASRGSVSYFIHSIEVIDRTLNSRVYTEDELIAMGFNTEFEQMGEEPPNYNDQTPPELAAFAASPVQFDTSGAARDVRFTARAIDAGSGVGRVSVLIMPSTFDLSYFGARSLSLRLVAGTAHDGAWRRIETFEHRSPPERYSLYVTIEDKAGNLVGYKPEELAARGWPHQIEQTGDGDVDSPTLEGFDFSPNTIDTADAERTVEARVSAADSDSGVREIAVSIVHPNGATQQRTVWEEEPGASGEYVLPFKIARHSQRGRYYVEWVKIRDQIGRLTTLGRAAIEARGFESYFTNQQSGS